MSRMMSDPTPVTPPSQLSSPYYYLKHEKGHCRGIVIVASLRRYGVWTPAPAGRVGGRMTSNQSTCGGGTS